jgi:hypothetical protein
MIDVAEHPARTGVIAEPTGDACPATSGAVDRSRIAASVTSPSHH